MSSFTSPAIEATSAINRTEYQLITRWAGSFSRSASLLIAFETYFPSECASIVSNVGPRHSARPDGLSQADIVSLKALVNTIIAHSLINSSTALQTDRQEWCTSDIGTPARNLAKCYTFLCGVTFCLNPRLQRSISQNAYSLSDAVPHRRCLILARISVPVAARQEGLITSYDSEGGRWKSFHAAAAPSSHGSHRTEVRILQGKHFAIVSFRSTRSNLHLVEDFWRQKSCTT